MFAACHPIHTNQNPTRAWVKWKPDSLGQGLRKMKPWGATFEEEILNLKNHPLIDPFCWIPVVAVWFNLGKPSDAKAAKIQRFLQFHGSPSGLVSHDIKASWCGPRCTDANQHAAPWQQKTDLNLSKQYQAACSI